VKAFIKTDGDIKIAEHDTWVVSPRLYACVQDKLPDQPDFRSNIGALRYWCVKFIVEPYLPETQLILMHNGEIVQVIEIEWRESEKEGEG